MNCIPSVSHIEILFISVSKVLVLNSTFLLVSLVKSYSCTVTGTLPKKKYVSTEKQKVQVLRN